jgi:hypothetical protein
VKDDERRRSLPNEATWEEWQARKPEDRITLAAFQKYTRRAFDAGYDMGLARAHETGATEAAPER